MTSVQIDEAARRLGVSRRTVYNRITSGHLLTVHAAGSQRVTLESLAVELRRDDRPKSAAEWRRRCLPAPDPS